MLKTLLKNKTSLSILIAIGTAITYGLYPPAARAVYADGGNAAFVVLAATLTRTLALVVFCLLTKKSLFANQQDIKMGATGGFLQAVTVLSIFAALTLIPGPIVIIIIFTHTLMLLFLMAWKKELILDVPVIITTVVALLGLSFVLDVWHRTPYNLFGIFLAFIAAIVTMSRLYVYGQLTKTRNPAVIGAENFIFATFFVILAICFWHPHLPVTSTGYFYTALACLSQATATFGMFYGIALLGSFQWSLLAKLEPIFTALFSFLLIKEVLNTGQYFGITIVVVSLVAYQYSNHQKQKLLIK